VLCTVERRGQAGRCRELYKRRGEADRGVTAIHHHAVLERMTLRLIDDKDQGPSPDGYQGPARSELPRESEYPLRCCHR